MSKVNLFDALEICLRALDKGADVEACLALFPNLKDDLRPILMAAVEARSNPAREVSVDAARRGKARVLQAAAEMREQNNTVSTSSSWRSTKKSLFGTRFFRLAITTVVMLVFLLTGGTGLVSASSNALPGDHLYPVKRSWEDVRLFFVLDPGARVRLEHEFEDERVQEIHVLYSENRVAQVNFQGVVQSHNDDDWVIGGLNISVDDQTRPEGNVIPGVTVQVVGETENGVIKAKQIILIATPVVIPTILPSPTFQPTETEGIKPQGLEQTQAPSVSPQTPQTLPEGTQGSATEKPNGGKDGNESKDANGND
jgi:hypothetical protein